MTTLLWRWGRVVVGAAILGLLVWRWGTGPFVAGLRLVDGWSLAAAAGIAALTTMCCAWRWKLVSRGLGVELSFPSAVAACYRSQFLNTALPGGVLGDVHRGVRHGVAAGDVGRGLRSVGWERTAGQVVQLVVAIAVLSVVPSPVRGWTPLLGIVVVAAVLGALLVARSGRGVRQSRWARTCRAAAADVRYGLLANGAWPGVAVASVLVVAGHTATFLIAARTAGADVSLPRLLPLALLVLLAMSVPTNIGGWGPREGVAAWSFAAAGLGATQGLSTAVVYGVMALVATLPGAFVLVAGSRRRGALTPVPVGSAEPPLVDIVAGTGGGEVGG